MIKVFSKRKKATQSKLDVLLQSVVSVYLYMAQTAKLSGSEINVIDRILHSMFGNEIPLYQIEQARRNILSIRDAANQLNACLSPADKIKLILNLISLAYHDRSKIHVLGNVEIVELVDLLRVDVNILDLVYDLFETDACRLDIPLELFTSRQTHYLLNSMVWGKSGSDFTLKNTDDSYRFIIIENLVLVAQEQGQIPSQANLVNSQNGEILALQNQRFYRIRDTNTLQIKSGATQLCFSLEDIWRLYAIRSSASLFSRVVDDTHKSRICYKDGRLILDKGTRNYGLRAHQLALDEQLTDHQKTCTVAEFILHKATDRESDESLNERYLELENNKPRISNTASANTLVKFARDGRGWHASVGTDTPIFLNKLPLIVASVFNLNQDVLTLGSNSFIINKNWELIEIPLQIDELKVEDVYHRFSKEGNVAIDGVSFCLKQGNMMAIMGPSGSGKTTLLKVLLGEIIPERARISIDGIDFVSNYAFFQKHIGYVPQDDLLFANLTVYENLYYNLRLRLPNIRNKDEIDSRIFNLLRNVGLYEQRFMIVGDVMHKKLSGGQRRRLNIALELISNPMIIILDEPTSGLSSKDSENITQFLSELKTQGKIIICTIHQPNATIFKQFDNIMLMDKGGCEVFFGTITDVFDYFQNEHSLASETLGSLTMKKELNMPEYFFDLIEISDQYQQRLFPPSYWKQKYRDYKFRMALDLDARLVETDQISKEQQVSSESGLSLIKSFLLLMRRNFTNKIRSKINIFMTMAVAPLLAFFTAIILRSTPQGSPYSFYENSNFMLFAFISIIIFIFIGLANSVDDILSEKRIIQREKKMNIGAGAILGSKYFVLFCMTIVQALLYYVVSSYILQIKGSMLPLVAGLLFSGILGYKMGLLASSVIHDRSAVINILPLIIIPQIMFSGAVIQFNDMNPRIRLNKDQEVPEFCQIIPSRWLYEGMVLAQYHYNRHTLVLTRYTSLFKDRDMDPRLKRQKIKQYAQKLEIHEDIHHTNSTAFNAIRINHGKFLNEDRNIFLSHTMKLGDRELKTVFVDLAICLLISGLLSLFTWIKIKYFYD